MTQYYFVEHQDGGYILDAEGNPAAFTGSDAVDEVLSYGGHTYEVRESDGYYAVWHSPRSVNNAAGAGALAPLSGTEAKSRDEAWALVLDLTTLRAQAVAADHALERAVSLALETVDEFPKGQSPWVAEAKAMLDALSNIAGE